MDNAILTKAANNIRVLALAMVEKAKSGHPGGAMGGADFINLLYTEFLNFNPDDMNWPFRDRFFLDPGHMSPMLYSVLHLVGTYTTDDLMNFRQWQSPTPGHPELDAERGIENTSGPLGQGHAMAVGSAIAERFLVARFGEWMAHKTYAFISDGGIQEEVSQGTGRIAGYLGLNNLVMFYDANEVQLSTKVDAVTHENTAAKYEAWGWRVIAINGNNPDEIRGALIKAEQEKEKPVLIIGQTTMGKGALKKNNESFEGQVSTHGQPLSAAGGSVEKTIMNLGGDPIDPFAVFPETKEVYQAALDRKREKVKVKKEEFEIWKKENPGLATKLENILSCQIPAIDYSKIEFKSNIATRTASSKVLGEFATTFDNMLVMSADLANSDKTDGFLKKNKPIVKGDFSGAFLHAGVSELTMASIANGMALTNLIPVCGTFFAFSDFMKPAIRLAALMQLPVKYVWTHDSFRVGEDGPTHQPVEQEAQIRLMEKLKNHKGKNSMLVLRPADSAETAIAWKIAVENHDTPTGLILSRQNINDLPASSTADRFEIAKQAENGGYIVQKAEGKPDVILVASGSEVSTLVEAAELLQNMGYKVQVTSAISEGLFRLQDRSYQENVIPSDIPVFALTAGLPVTMEGLAGKNGTVFGLDHFGFSAPYKILDVQFGFYGESVKAEVVKFLEKFV
ncbi:MAG: transketolase [Bacteroidales bacterium]|nr:transketolase [Bacteroidales bacterium]